MIRIAVFVSGGGTNLENIAHYFADKPGVEIALVISNRADAYALTRAERLGIHCVVLSAADFRNPDVLLPILKGIDFIVLAGFLLMAPPFLTSAYPHRMLNIHPALLPKYGGKGMYGHFVHEAVKRAGETESGITIHYVSDVCDGGEMVFQAKTPILPSDSPDDIADKVHQLEQRYFPGVIERVLKEQFPEYR